MQIRTNLLIKLSTITLILIYIVSIGLLSSIISYGNKEILTKQINSIELETLKEEINSINTYQDNNYIIGRVITRDIHNFYNEVVINLGSNDNIHEHDAVINEEGLIGIVYKVNKDYSTVKLLTGNYNISIRINETYGNLNKGKITLLNKYSDINEGDKVYTSGYSNIKKDIYIGKINKVDYDNEYLGKEATISLIDNTNLNYIAVIRNNI